MAEATQAGAPVPDVSVSLVGDSSGNQPTAGDPGSSVPTMDDLGLGRSSLADLGGGQSAAEPPEPVTVKQEFRVKKEFKLSDVEGQRRSAFMAYKPATTILTNLQRGNVQAQVGGGEPVALTLHQRAGMGDLTPADLQMLEDVDEVDEVGYTALMWASSYGQVPTARLLIEHKANIDHQGPDGETPLIMATSHGHYEVVRLLVNAGADINHADQNGNTALMFAAYSNSPHSVNELLFGGADVTATNENDQSALSIAIHRASQFAQVVLERHLMSQVLSKLKQAIPESVATALRPDQIT